MKLRYWIALAVGLTGIGALLAAGAAKSQQVAGGHDVLVDDHPWQVALRIYHPDGYDRCGGILVAAEWILTAAHCLSGVTAANQIMFVTGKTNVSLDYINSGQWFAIKNYFLLDCYTGKTDSNGIMTNDVALIQLPNPDASWREGALLLPDPGLPALKALEVTGWGRTLFQRYPSHLQGADVEYVDDATCKAAFPGSIKASMLCAGRKDIGTCLGDSGGPLVTKSGKFPKYLVGVVSSGDNCNYSLKFGVYSRVSIYAPWILSAVQTHGWIDHLDQARVADRRKACSALGVASDGAH